MGLFVGDAAGATLEFYANEFSLKEVHRAMRMPGGGRLGVAPGQVTDDSELAIHLWRALRGQDPRDGFPEDAVAQEYIRWHRSSPFDMGHTCARAFGFATDGKSMRQNAIQYNMESQANGALMRLAPLIVWASPAQHSLSHYAYIRLAEADACLSHCNPVCQSVNRLYMVLLTALLNAPDSASIEDRIHRALEAVRVELMDIHDTVQAWVLEVLRDQKETFECTRNVGHVKHALQLTLYCLLKNMSFEDGIAFTLMRGGDTDTNAAIVGAVLGALHGYDAIPEYMRTPVLQHDPEHNSGNIRPNTYRIADVLDTVARC